MTSRSTSALRKPRQEPGDQEIWQPSNPRQSTKTGKLPEWNLADLYSGIDAPEVARDLDRMDAECIAFETDYKGKLAAQIRQKTAESGLPRRSGATRRSTISPAGSDPMRASFMPATASMRRSPNSTATFPSG